jgi:hypothetical protein
LSALRIGRTWYIALACALWRETRNCYVRFSSQALSFLDLATRGKSYANVDLFFVRIDLDHHGICSAKPMWLYQRS